MTSCHVLFQMPYELRRRPESEHHTASPAPHTTSTNQPRPHHHRTWRRPAAEPATDTWPDGRQARTLSFCAYVACCWARKRAREIFVIGRAGASESGGERASERSVWSDTAWDGAGDCPGPSPPHPHVQQYCPPCEAALDCRAAAAATAAVCPSVCVCVCVWRLSGAVCFAMCGLPPRTPTEVYFLVLCARRRRFGRCCVRLRAVVEAAPAAWRRSWPVADVPDTPLRRPVFCYWNGLVGLT